MSNKFHPDLPPAASEAAVVQAFFAKILSNEYNVSQERAQQVSSKWEFGSVREVTTFSKASYIGIFGHEAGEILFASVQRRQRRRKQSDNMSNSSSSTLFLFIAASITAVLFYVVMPQEEHTKIFTWALPLFLSAIGVMAHFFILD